MSSNALEDGEIDSEHEALQDFNNEGIIDEIVQKENNSAVKISENQSRKKEEKRQNSRERRAKNRPAKKLPPRRVESARESTSSLSWRPSNNVGNTERLRRPPPLDSVMFPNMQNNSISAHSSHQPHPHFYPTPQQPPLPNFNFFNPPPNAHQFAGPPPPPPRLQQITGTYRGANYDNVRMEIAETPEEPSSLPREPSKPPVQIPLTSILPPPPPPPVLHEEPDADTLRQMLLSQMTLKRGAEPVKSTTKRKKSRSISKTVESAPVPPPKEPVVPVPIAHPKPEPVPEPQLDKQMELGAEIQKLDVFIKESQSSIRSEHEELKTLTERCKWLKESMGKRRTEIKEAAAKKRDLQNQLEALDEEELDILCDDILFEKIFRPAVPVVPVQAKVESVKTTSPKLEAKQPEAVQPTPPAQVNNEEIVQSEFQAISESENSGEEELEDEEEVGDEEEEEEEIEVVVPANSKPSSIVISSGLNAELSLREKLLAKCGKSRQSPDVPAIVTSSSPDRAESCRNFLLKLCKFELNGTCTKGRDCSFLHLVDVTDETQQRQLIEGLLRDVLAYREIDIEAAISDVLAFLPRFEQFEKMVHYFLTVVMQRNPEFRSRLFEFFANGR